MGALRLFCHVLIQDAFQILVSGTLRVPEELLFGEVCVKLFIDLIH